MDHQVVHEGVRDRVLAAVRAALGPVGALAIALWLVRAASAGGLVVSPDSVVYLQGAQALSRGEGFVLQAVGGPQAITHFPPLYSVALALVGGVSRDLLEGALALNVGLAVALPVIVWIGLRRAAHLGQWPTVITLVLIVASPALIVQLAMVSSEPLFVVTSVAGLFLLVRFLRRAHRGVLAGSALVLAAAALTRFAGLSLLAAAPLLVLAWRDRPWRSRLVDASVFVGSAAPVLAAWLLHQRTLGLSATGRTLALHLPTIQNWRDGATATSLWLFPPRVPAFLGAPVVLALAMVLLIVVLRSGGRDGSGAAPPGPATCARVFLVAGFGYLVFVILSRSVADAAIPFDGRLLVPASAYLVIGVSAALGSCVAVGARAKRLAVILAVLLIVTLPRLAHNAALSTRDPWGYSSHGFTGMAAELVSLQRTAAYSNDPEFFLFSFGRPVRPLPSRYNPLSLATNELFADEVRALCRDLAATGRSVLFLRSTARTRRWYPTMSDLMVLGHLRKTAEGWNWVLMRPRECT